MKNYKIIVMITSIQFQFQSKTNSISLTWYDNNSLSPNELSSNHIVANERKTNLKI